MRSCILSTQHIKAQGISATITKINIIRLIFPFFLEYFPSSEILIVNNSFFFWQCWKLNPGLHSYQTSFLLLRYISSQSIFVYYFYIFNLTLPTANYTQPTNKFVPPNTEKTFSGCQTSLLPSSQSILRKPSISSLSFLPRFLYCQFLLQEQYICIVESRKQKQLQERKLKYHILILRHLHHENFVYTLQLFFLHVCVFILPK